MTAAVPVMAHDRDLDQLSDLLNQCLGRIEAEAFRMQEGVEDLFPGDGADEAIESETAHLQDAVEHFLAALDRERERPVDLNRIVARAIDGALRRLSFPVLLRSRLAPDLPPVAQDPHGGERLPVLIERAFLLAAAHAGAGGEVEIGTRHDLDALLLEITARGPAAAADDGSRAATLQDFVAGLGGRCELAWDDAGSLRLCVNLPALADHDPA